MAQQVLADLPVHCTGDEIFGDWTFHLGPAFPSPHLCGHHRPGTAQDVLATASGASWPSFKTDLSATRVHLRLDGPDLASETVAGESTDVGWWTMIYNQGFEVRINGRAFFAFSSFVTAPNASGFISQCSRTAVGWFHDLRNESQPAWGCYQGVQTRRGNATARPHLPPPLAPDRTRPDATRPHPKVPTQSSIGTSPPAVRAAADERPDGLKYAGLPAAWDWRDVQGINYVPPGRSQGDCGACYVIATVAMLESRLAIASGAREAPTLSVQEILSCSPYSQGCEGGFPYLVGKYLTDVGAVAEACFPTQVEDGQRAPTCSALCEPSPRRWQASDYRYVGGRYGACSETEMMQEIYKNGPIVVGFQASTSLYAYIDGIYTSPPAGKGEASLVEQGANRDSNGGGVDGGSTGGGGGEGRSGPISFFERTNHAVLVVGWGEDEAGRRFWWAQNTWGVEWGLGGYFKMARGHDDSAFESMAVAVDVDGALPLPMLQASGDIEDNSGEARRIFALQRRAALRRAAQPAAALVFESEPPPSPSPHYARLEEPRESIGAWASSTGPGAVGTTAHHSWLLDALVHWRYGGG